MATILVVDDRPTNRQFLITLLGYSGHRLLEAADGAEALEMVRAERPDLIITDILMPTMDGYEFVQKLRAEPALAHTPVIFYTATYRENEARVLAKACGVEYVLSKPSEPPLILQTVQAALGTVDSPATPPPITMADNKLGITRLRQLGEEITRYFTDLQSVTQQLTIILERGEAMIAERDFLLSVAAKFSSVVADLQDMNLRLTGLNELGFNLIAERDPARMLALFCGAARKIMGAKYAAIGILAEDEQTLKHFYSSGLEAETAAHIGSTLPSEGMLGRILAERRPVRLRDVSTDPHGIGLPAHHPPIQSFLSAPILTTSQLYGQFYVADKLSTDEFSEDDERLAVTLAAQVAVAYENVQLYGQVQRHAAKLQLEVVEHQRTQVALAESERHYRQLIETAHEGVWVIDTNNCTTLVNHRATEIVGYSREEIIGKSLFDFMDEERKAQALASIARVQQGIHEQIEFGFQRKNGEVAWALIETSGLHDEAGNYLGGLAMLTDITERKRAEEEIRRHLAELEAVHKVSTALRTARTLDEMLPLFISETVAVVQATSGSIWLYDSADDKIEMVAHQGWGPKNPQPLRGGEGAPGHVMQTGEPHLTRDFKSDPLTSEINRALIPEGTAGACLPIQTEAEVIGVMFVAVQQPREFTAAEVRLLTTLAEIAGNAIHRMRLREQTEQRLHRLTALRAIDQAISSSLDLKVTLHIVLDQVVSQLNVEAAAILLFNPYLETLEYAAGRGFHSRGIERSHLALGEGQAGRAALEGRVINIPDIREGNTGFARATLLADENFITYFAAPLIAKKKIKGVLDIFLRRPFSPDEDWLDFLETLAGQTAIAIDSAELFQDLQRSNTDLRLAYDTTLEGWSAALDLRDKETEGHTQRVTEMTLRLARAMGFTEEELVHVRRGALLHDIGKMGIPDGILLKPGKLTDEEWAIMRKHPTYAQQMLSPIAYLREALPIPYCHHEKWDGTGYPQGLKGEQIPRAARIFAVVDVWDALRSDRPYRAGWPEDRVLEHIRAGSGTHFDPKVVEAFIALTEKQSSEESHTPGVADS